MCLWNQVAENPCSATSFDRNNTGKVPSAHIEFHGKHPELEQAMRECGDSTDRAKARKKGKARCLSTPRTAASSCR
jgi:hypothetical protein